MAHNLHNIHFLILGDLDFISINGFSFCLMETLPSKSVVIWIFHLKRILLKRYQKMFVKWTDVGAIICFLHEIKIIITFMDLMTKLCHSDKVDTWFYIQHFQTGHFWHVRSLKCVFNYPDNDWRCFAYVNTVLACKQFVHLNHIQNIKMNTSF